EGGGGVAHVDVGVPLVCAVVGAVALVEDDGLAPLDLEPDRSRDDVDELLPRVACVLGAPATGRVGDQERRHLLCRRRTEEVDIDSLDRRRELRMAAASDYDWVIRRGVGQDVSQGNLVD